MTNLSHVLGMLTPRSGEDLISVLLLDQALLAVVSGLPRYLTDLKSGRKCHSVVSNSLWPHGLEPIRLLHPWDLPGKNTGVGCHLLLQGKEYPVIEPVSPPIHGIFQARILEGVAICFSREKETQGLNLGLTLWAESLLSEPPGKPNLLVWRVQEIVPSGSFFPYLELHYYSNWSYIIIFLINQVSNYIIIINFIWVSVTHLVM